MRNLRDQTVVIAGASSGMGLASALAFARLGCNLVLAARREEAVKQAALRCNETGAAEAVGLVADVTDPRQMGALASAAMERFGRIDVWVNMAGLSMWGAFEEIPVEAQARLVQVNLIGVMNGCHAALPHMLRQGRGVLINMSSIGGRMPMPFAAAYTASKYGVTGFTEALRDEVSARSGVKVCGVYPGFVDTPTNLHSANYTGRTLRPIPPVLDPEKVAEGIVSLAQYPRRSLHLGLHNALAVPYAVAPEATGRTAGKMMEGFLLHSGQPAPATEGTLFDPVAEGTTTRGGWRPDPGTATSLTASLALLAAVPIGLLALSVGLGMRGRR
ncbi:SDR family oxidoreductase [Roseomonas harenae]|uniref:SDR family oxidoreductase n=1 Tax=Muricoccus harenae TaxID=2692566 RepID=UPI001331964B|nr:SDR family oxidoreductase [Roseomonas harenae]